MFIGHVPKVKLFAKSIWIKGLLLILFDIVLLALFAIPSLGDVFYSVCGRPESLHYQKCGVLPQAIGIPVFGGLILTFILLRRWWIHILATFCSAIIAIVLLRLSLWLIA